MQFFRFFYAEKNKNGLFFFPSMSRCPCLSLSVSEQVRWVLHSGDGGQAEMAGKKERMVRCKEEEGKGRGGLLERSAMMVMMMMRAK